MASEYELLYRDEYDVDDLLSDNQQDGQLPASPGRPSSQVQVKRHFILTDPSFARKDGRLTYLCFWPGVGSSSESHAPAA